MHLHKFTLTRTYLCQETVTYSMKMRHEQFLTVIFRYYSKTLSITFLLLLLFFYNLGEGLLTLSILLKGLFDLAPSRTIRGSIPDEQIRSIASVHVHETLTPENSKMFRFHLDKFSNLHSSRKRRLWPRLYFDIVSRF